jgi:hypothetical protein
MDSVGEKQHDAGLKNPEGEENFPEQAALHSVTFDATA